MPGGSDFLQMNSTRNFRLFDKLNILDLTMYDTYTTNRKSEKITHIIPSNMSRTFIFNHNNGRKFLKN